MAAFSSAGMEARNQLKSGRAALEKIIRFCPASASRSALALLKRVLVLDAKYNSADICRPYRHEDDSTLMSEPAMSATGGERSFAPDFLHEASRCYAAPEYRAERILGLCGIL